MFKIVDYSKSTQAHLKLFMNSLITPLKLHHYALFKMIKLMIARSLPVIVMVWCTAIIRMLVLMTVKPTLNIELIKSYNYHNQNLKL